MKRGFIIFFAMCIILCINLIKPPQTVEAKDTKVASGAWLTGTEVDVDALVPTDLNLLTKGVKVSEPGLICHPFQGGQFNWVGEIRQLVKGKWMKLPTVSDWVPSTEGVFTGCAQAPAAGIYALFGYYNGPYEIVNNAPDGKPFDCSISWFAIFINTAFDETPPTENYIFAHFSSVPVGTPVTYSVTGTDPENSFVAYPTGSGILDSAGTVVFNQNPFMKDTETWSSLTVDFSLLGCTYTHVFTNLLQ